MTKLTPIQEHWDNNTLNYDLKKFNWPAWALDVIQEIAAQVTELETMHQVLSPSEIVRVSQHVQNACTYVTTMSTYHWQSCFHLLLSHPSILNMPP